MTAISNLEGNLRSFQHKRLYHLHGILLDACKPLHLGFLLLFSHADVEAYALELFLFENPFRKSIVPE